MLRACRACARLQAEKDELMQTLVRRQADFENYRKRIERERQEEQRRGVRRLARGSDAGAGRVSTARCRPTTIRPTRNIAKGWS